MFESRALGMNVKGILYRRMVVPTTCCAKTWSMGAAEKKRLNVMEIRYLKSMCGVTWIIRNEEARTDVLRDLAGWAE